MYLKQIKDRNEWNEALKQVKHTSFLQSWEWGELQNSKQNFFFAVVQDDNVLALASLIKKKAFIFNYFYCPQGPIVFSGSYSSVFGFLTKEIRKIAIQERVSFLRFNLKEQLNKKGLKKTIDIEPKKTIILDLSIDSEELLKKMHSKTRYNIKLALKKEVKIEEASSDDFEDFWKLMLKTSNRDSFRIHNKEYYRKLVNFSDDFIKLFVAKKDGKIIASSIVSFFGDTVTYVHGCSDYEYRKLMAPYALQWHVIQYSKDKDYKYYDFYGIDVDKWPGVTRFKMGFNGEIVDSLGTFDLVFNSFQYFLYNIMRRFRRISIK